MNGAPDEYDLADDPESEGPEADPSPLAKPTPPRAAGQPLPRMWKSDPDDEPAPPRTPIPNPRGGATPTPPPPPRRRGTADDSGTTRKTGLKPKAELNEKGEKKVLIEDTPVLDTYETRQRIRLATGGMLVFVLGLGVYIVYNLFLYDPFPMDDLPPDDGYVVEAPPQVGKPDLDLEARAMMARARDSARNGRTDEAIALLGQLVQAYPKTRTAAEAQEALERPGQNLPLFLDGPTVQAAAPAPQPPAQPAAPPAVVDARPPNAQVGGDASLINPANSAETLAPPAVGEAEAAVQAVSPGEAPDRRLPPGFAARPGSGVDPSGWPMAIVGDRDGATMVFVPGGVFLMGEDGDPQFASPAHKVRLGAYYIDRHEVTVGQFRRFLSETRYRGRPPTTWPADDKNPAAESMPMVMVSQADALAYAEWAGKALPTEAQWEASARTSDGRIYPWGDEPANYSKPRVPRQVNRVMSFPEDRSPYDVFDLAGNVQEWTADVFDRNYYRSLAGRIVDDPTGPAAKAGKYDVVVKGAKLGAASSREPIAPEKRLNYVGFRCALQVERPPAAPAAAAPIAAPATSPSQPAPTPTAPPPAQPSQPVEPF
ncbi:SUMF1/EgtB/PvdO family nonheme iron enzyme [Paludisphaera soli]|uniref:SUMF1/EgtB/PvdO family nonheme iron enzyme n=1 Tax=Paludisphaera soli TaxID=2712865 RepID=UPI0013EB5C13|nr:SUMF1/EgtB/PvdO family nonheme iron enzyme [Paludisphaera soli]